MDGELTFTMPMVMHNEFHEPGPKTLLNGTVLAERASVDGVADIMERVLIAMFEEI